jgi:tetratricopeptide (TPR) repeat protein
VTKADGKSGAAKKSSSKRRGSKPSAPSRLVAEKTMLDVHKVLEARNFETPEALNAFLETLLGPGLAKALGDLPPISPQEEAREQAQELAFAAMEAPSRARALMLARRALAKDPDCVDALVIVTAATSRSGEDAIAGLEKAVAAGERSLGAEYFEENKGDFWSLIETRPYMRARSDLADMLLNAGRASEAIGHFETLLDLNPNDNQGIRDILLACYLAGDQLDGARRLLLTYKDDASAVFAWARMLERLLSEDFERAAKLLQQARRNNRFVELYFTAQKGPPLEMPGSYSPGSEEEAQLCAETLSEVLVKHPKALLWLMTRILGAGETVPGLRKRRI